MTRDASADVTGRPGTTVSVMEYAAIILSDHGGYCFHNGDRGMQIIR